MKVWTYKNFKEIEIMLDDGQYMCALINGNYGWLMYLREESDSGLSSCNLNYNDSENKTMEFTLSNGQVDSYPISWVIPVETVNKALQYFKETHRIPDFITWHDDYGEYYDN